MRTDFIEKIKSRMEELKTDIDKENNDLRIGVLISFLLFEKLSNLKSPNEIKYGDEFSFDATKIMKHMIEAFALVGNNCLGEHLDKIKVLFLTQNKDQSGMSVDNRVDMPINFRIIGSKNSGSIVLRD